MKMQNIKFIVSILLASFLLLSLVSSLSISAPSNSITSNRTTTQVTLTSSSSDPTLDITFSLPNIVSGSSIVTFESIPAITLTPGQSKQITIETDTISDGFGFGSFSSTLTATAKNASNSSQVIDTRSTAITYVNSFCSNGITSNDLRINNVDISSSGDDDEEWSVLDTITVEVEVENRGDDDIDDIFVELALFDSSGSNVADDLEFLNDDEEEIELGDLRDGDEETVTFEFKVPADFDTGNYKLAVKAYSDDLGESNACVDRSSDLDNDYYQSISVESEDDEGKFIAFDDIELSANDAVCGDTVTLTTNVVNIGDEDQDRVRVNLKSDQLNLDVSQEITSGLDEGDDKEVSFTFTVPQGLAERTYVLELTADYDYSRGNYRESSDDETQVPLRVFGCTLAPTQNDRVAIITASLGSDVEAGSELVVTSRITNPSNQAATLVIDASGYNSWAELSSISSRTLSLDAGQSKEVTFRFNVNEDVTGDQSFTIEASANGKSETRQVSVDFGSQQNQGSSFNFSLGDNWLIWTIGIVNVLLIVIIIIVAVVISRR